MKSTYLISEFSEMTGIPIRTLHYYDDIGLLKPHRSVSGHREYKMNDLVELQKILSLKSLGFSLEQIGGLLKLPMYDLSLVEMLKLQQQTLELKRLKLEESLEMISRMIALVQVEEQLEHELLFSLVRNMNQEGMQREWVANHLSEHTAASLFDMPAENVEQLDAETVQFSREVKRLSVGPPDSQEAEAVIGLYVKRVMAFLDQEAIENFSNLDDEQVAKLDHLVEMPFNEAETAWLEKALASYLAKHALIEQGKLTWKHGELSGDGFEKK